MRKKTYRIVAFLLATLLVWQSIPLTIMADDGVLDENSIPGEFIYGSEQWIKLTGEGYMLTFNDFNYQPPAEPTDDPEATPTGSPEPTPTGSPEATPTGSPEATPTGSPETTPTGSPAPTGSPEPTPTVTPTVSPEPTPTVTPTVSPESTPTTSPEMEATDVNAAAPPAPAPLTELTGSEVIDDDASPTPSPTYVAPVWDIQVNKVTDEGEETIKQEAFDGEYNLILGKDQIGSFRVRMFVNGDPLEEVIAFEVKFADFNRDKVRLSSYAQKVEGNTITSWGSLEISNTENDATVFADDYQADQWGTSVTLANSTDYFVKYSDGLISKIHVTIVSKQERTSLPFSILSLTKDEQCTFRRSACVTKIFIPYAVEGEENVVLDFYGFYRTLDNQLQYAESFEMKEHPEGVVYEIHWSTVPGHVSGFDIGVCGSYKGDAFFCDNGIQAVFDELEEPNLITEFFDAQDTEIEHPELEENGKCQQQIKVKMTLQDQAIIGEDVNVSLIKDGGTEETVDNLVWTQVRSDEQKFLGITTELQLKEKGKYTLKVKATDLAGRSMAEKTYTIVVRPNLTMLGNDLLIENGKIYYYPEDVSFEILMNGNGFVPEQVELSINDAKDEEASKPVNWHATETEDEASDVDVLKYAKTLAGEDDKFEVSLSYEGKDKKSATLIVDKVAPDASFDYTYNCNEIEGQKGDGFAFLKRCVGTTTYTYAHVESKGVQVFTNYPEILITATDTNIDADSLRILVNGNDINAAWKKVEGKNEYTFDMHLIYYKDFVEKDKYSYKIEVVGNDLAGNPLKKVSDEIVVFNKQNGALLVLDNGKYYEPGGINDSSVGQAINAIFVVNNASGFDNVKDGARKDDKDENNANDERSYTLTRTAYQKDVPIPANAFKYCEKTGVIQYNLTKEDASYEECINISPNSYNFIFQKNNNPPGYMLLISEKGAEGIFVGINPRKWVSNKAIPIRMYATHAVAEQIDFLFGLNSEGEKQKKSVKGKSEFTLDVEVPKGELVEMQDKFIFNATVNDKPQDGIGVEIEIYPGKPMLSLLYKGCFYEYGNPFYMNGDWGLYASDDPVFVLVFDGEESIVRDAFSTITVWDMHGEEKGEGSLLGTYYPFDDNITYEEGVGYKFPITVKGEGKHSLKIVCESAGDLGILCNMDKASDEENAFLSKTVRVDKSAPLVQVSYPTPKRHAAPGGEEKWYYQGGFKATFEFTDDNLEQEEVKIRVYKDGEMLYEANSAPDEKVFWDLENRYLLNVSFGEGDDAEAEGEYYVEIECQDQAKNIAKYAERIGDGQTGTYKSLAVYRSPKIVIDKTDPTFERSLGYEKYDETEEIQYFGYEQMLVFRIHEKNNALMEIAEDGSFSLLGLKCQITASDYPDKMPEVKPYLGTLDENRHIMKMSADAPKPDNDTYYVVFEFEEDARYSVKIGYEDLAGRTAQYTYDEEFVIDNTPPENLDPVFSESVDASDEQAPGTLYYQKPFTVTLRAKDVTSEVTAFSYSIKQSIVDGEKTVAEDTVKANPTGEKGVYEATITIPQNDSEGTLDLIGKFSFASINKAKQKAESIDQKIVVVDSKKPFVRVEYNEGQRTGINTEEGIWYFNTTMSVPVAVLETNFDAKLLDLKVNGVLREDAKDGTLWRLENGGWWRFGGLGLNTAGRYEIEVNCSDHSGNPMDENSQNVRQTVVIDLQKPVITVSGGANPVNTSGDVKYFNHDVSYVVSVAEENLKPDTFEFSLTATDLEGRAISVPDYAAILKGMTGNSATLTFAADGIYTFSVKCKDWAGWESDLVTSERFVVDKSQPSIPTVNYNAPVNQKTQNETSYEYYNEPVTVTILAEDSVSSIQGFEYRFVSAGNVSAINKAVGPIYVSAGEISYSNAGRTATYSFKLPGNVLNADGQLNGTLEVKAVNKALLESVNSDARRIIADNVAPVISVTYNQQVNERDGVLYFDKGINSTIVIDEANFSSSEVASTVSVDGRAKNLDVAWSDRTVDRHIGTFTLSEDGRYEVVLNYADRSGNIMPEYRSKQMVIDSTVPEIHVSGIKYNSANKGEKIGFVLTISDENLDVDSVKIGVVAEYLDVNGKAGKEDVLGKGKKEISKDGKTVTYTVENLDKDAIYRLECSASDLAKNSFGGMYDDGGTKRNTFVFSVNREGSTYGMDETTQNIVGSYSTQPVDVTIVEINPNKLKNVKITLFKNDQTITLKEGDDYKVSEEGTADSWYKYTYVINKKVFEDDAAYRISAYSEDEAGNSSVNTLDGKHAEISFVIDKTGPSIIVANLEDKETYPVRNLSVLFQASDNMKLSKGTVYLDGEVKAVWDEAAIAAMSAAGKDFTFDVADESTKSHDVKIVMVDAAGNETVKEIKGFYVTTNLWIRYWNNKTAVVGTVAGILVLIGVAIALSKNGKRKRRN